MMRNGTKIALHRTVALAASVLALALPAHAYYQYVHFNGRNFAAPIYEKYDLSALPFKTVTFFVSDQTLAAYGPNDSFGSVVTQVKQAAATWNGVATSDLRVAFGGLESPSQLISPITPGGDVTFVDLPPGVIGLGAPLVPQAPVTSAAGMFFPIVRSTVMLSRDTNAGPGPSYLEAFYTTAVHEIGHALGLQHTWTGSAMSQGVIRNTSRTRPLDADDIAGLSVLYGKPGWAGTFGSVSGRVTFANGDPVSLASVMAISPAGPAVSALTNPDGTYRIDGLPASLSYLIYVHPLPPDAVAMGEGLRLPVDLNNNQFVPSGAFQTVFLRNGGGVTMDPQQALAVMIPAGTVATNINFSVQPRASSPTYDVVTYYQLDTAARKYVTYVNDTTVTGYPAFLDTTQNWGIIISRAAAPAFLPTPQSISILGGFAPALVNPVPYQWPLLWTMASGTVGAVFGTPIGAGVGPRHLVYNFGTDIYVLPNGVNLVQKGPPQINLVTPNVDGSVTIAGAGLGPDTSIFFDGLKAGVAVAFTGNDAQGTLSVFPPQGAAGQTATLTAYNPDGQNSMILQAQNPQTYTYPTAAQPSIVSMSYSALPANSSAAIDIATTGLNLSGDVTVGFGSDDVTVRRVWVLDPTHLIANVVVAPNAALGLTEVSVVSGFQEITQPAAFTTVPARPGLPVITSVANQDTTQALIYPGSTAVINGQNLWLSGTGFQLTMNDQPIVPQSVSNTQIVFVVPANLASGPARLNLNNGAVSAYPTRVQIDGPPATIVGLANQLGQSLLVGSVGLGDTVSILVTGIDPGVLTNWSRVQVTVGGLPLQLVQIGAAPNNMVLIQATMTQYPGSGQAPLMVLVDGAGTLPINITVR